jgi:hypothetical protein
MLQEREAAGSQRGSRVSETIVKVESQVPADEGSGTL